MTTQETLNQKNGEINDNKIYLKRTDYQAIREMEGGEPMNAGIKERRAKARADINKLEAEVAQLEERLREEELEAEKLGHTGEGEQL